MNVTDGSTRHQGIEIAALWQVSEHVSISGNVSWSDQIYTFDRIGENGTELIRDGNEIDTAPEWLGNIALTWTPNEKLSLQLSGDYVGEYFTNAANTQDYPGHLVGNLRASYEVSEALETFLIVRNITDKRYADRADFAFGNERFFPGEPLNLTVGIRKKFD